MRGKTRSEKRLGMRATGFNEAPAECGGKHSARRRDHRPVRRFNEAPAECGGKPETSSPVSLVAQTLQ